MSRLMWELVAQESEPTSEMLALFPWFPKRRSRASQHWPFCPQQTQLSGVWEVNRTWWGRVAARP